MNKIIKDGKVAILVSHGYGAGWSTWNHMVDDNQALFDPDIVQMVLDEADPSEIAELADRKFSVDDEDTFYTGGVDGLSVNWLPVGTRFMVLECDGYETIITENDLSHIA